MPSGLEIRHRLLDGKSCAYSGGLVATVLGSNSPRSATLPAASPPTFSEPLPPGRPWWGLPDPGLRSVSSPAVGALCRLSPGSGALWSVRSPRASARAPPGCGMSVGGGRSDAAGGLQRLRSRGASAKMPFEFPIRVRLSAMHWTALVLPSRQEALSTLLQNSRKGCGM